MKLKFYINKAGNKIYTLKNKAENKPTSDAHYKFIKILEAKTNSLD